LTLGPSEDFALAFERGRRALHKGPCRQASLAVIARERVDAVFALDRDLAASGVRVRPD